MTIKNPIIVWSLFILAVAYIIVIASVIFLLYAGYYEVVVLAK